MHLSELIDHVADIDARAILRARASVIDVSRRDARAHFAVPKGWRRRAAATLSTALIDRGGTAMTAPQATAAWRSVEKR